MLSLISPSKDLDFKSPSPISSSEIPRLWNNSTEILKIMQQKKVRDLKKLMDISDKLAEENVLRYQNMSIEFNSENSKPAIFAFSGDVYRGITASTFGKKEIAYSQKYLRILSGFYGLLKPLDLIQAYRLEMGLPLKINKSKNLYQFWNMRITELINEDIKQSNSAYLINLASSEYFKSVNEALISVPIIHIHFREFRNNKLSFLSYNAKKARGLMVQFMAMQKVKNLKELCTFDLENYHYEAQLSRNNDLFFIR